MLQVLMEKAFKLAMEPDFVERQQRTIAGAQTLATRLTSADATAAGIDVLTGGTDVHLALVDLRTSEVNGQEAEDRLHEAGITVNKNTIPFETRSPFQASGIRIGTPAVTTRGMGVPEMANIADMISEVLLDIKNVDKQAAIRQRVQQLTAGFPLPY